MGGRCRRDLARRWRRLWRWRGRGAWGSRRSGWRRVRDLCGRRLRHRCNKARHPLCSRSPPHRPATAALNRAEGRGGWHGRWISTSPAQLSLTPTPACGPQRCEHTPARGPQQLALSVPGGASRRQLGRAGEGARVGWGWGLRAAAKGQSRDGSGLGPGLGRRVYNLSLMMGTRRWPHASEASGGAPLAVQQRVRMRDSDERHGHRTSLAWTGQSYRHDCRQ